MTKRIFAVLLTVLMLLPMFGIIHVGADAVAVKEPIVRDQAAEKTVIEAMGAGQKAAKSILEYLK